MLTVNAGTYTLTESGGPAGYTAGAWTCTARNADRARRSPLPPAAAPPARSTTTTRPRHLTLVKAVDQRQRRHRDARHGVDAERGRADADLRHDRLAGGHRRQSVSAGTLHALARPAARPVHRSRRGPAPAARSTGTWSPCADGATPPARSSTTTSAAADPGQGRGQRRYRRHGRADRWTLTAAGPTTISGTTGSGSVTAARCPIGHYDLTESGPDGYTPPPGSAPGRLLDGDHGHARAGQRRDLHDHQHRPAAAADPGQEGHQRQRRHRGADRLDADCGRPDRRSPAPTGSPPVTDGAGRRPATTTCPRPAARPATPPVTGPAPAATRTVHRDGRPR